MTALAEALARLSELLPDRVKVRVADRAKNRYYYAQVTCNGGHEELVGVETTHHAGSPGTTSVWFEYALREEVQGRGWWWSLQAKNGQAYALVSPSHDLNFSAVADSPALALALATIAALEAQA